MLADIITIGREILTGQTIDTNSSFLARKLTAMGARVRRITAVDDDKEAIAREVRRSVDEGATIVLTTGGLGPTSDDLTLEAVAYALLRKTELNPDALKFIQERYHHFAKEGSVKSEEITKEREKMAHLPAGASILINPVGAAPGVYLEEKNTFIACLPGVPAEMKAIFEEALEEKLRERLGKRGYAELSIKTKERDESVLAKALKKVMASVPGSYLKSKPTHFGSDVSLEVCISAYGDSESEAKERVSKAAEELMKLIEQ